MNALFVSQALLVWVLAGDGEAPAENDALAVGQCRVQLKVDELLKGSTCYVDEKVSKRPGTLRFPCSGDGPATARFGAYLFHGEVRAGEFDLVLRTEFPWEDHCQWTSEQHLRGNPKTGRMAYSYSERPRPDQSGCLSSCSAEATVKVAPPPR
jgi:hypothetical protein